MKALVEVDTLVESRHVISPSSKQFVAIGQSVQVRLNEIVTGVVRLRIGHDWILNSDMCNELEPMWYLLVHACATALDGEHLRTISQITLVCYSVSLLVTALESVLFRRRVQANSNVVHQ